MRYANNTILKDGERNNAYACFYQFGKLQVIRVTSDNYKITELVAVFDNRNEAIEHYKNKKREALISEFELAMKKLEENLRNLEIEDID